MIIDPRRKLSNNKHNKHFSADIIAEVEGRNKLQMNPKSWFKLNVWKSNLKFLNRQNLIFHLIYIM